MSTPAATITGHLVVGADGRLQETVAVDLYDGRVAPAAASGRGRGGRGGRGRGRTLLLFGVVPRCSC